MKKLIAIGVGLGLLVASFSPIESEAAQMSTNIGASRVINLSGSNTYWRIASVVVDNTNAATVARVFFYDTPNTNLVYTVSAYSNIVRTVGTLTNIYTNVLGTIQTNTYPGLLITTQSVAAVTNQYPLLYSVVVNSNSVSSYEPPVPFTAQRGLTVSNSASANITINYDFGP